MRVSGGNYQSAYLNDGNYGIASTGFNEGLGGFLVSGKATSPGDACTCEYLHWGYWAVMEDNDGMPSNARSSLGVFVAGQPTVEMPITGTATYDGVVEAAWRQDGPNNPTGRITHAQGTFNHTVHFDTGLGSGSMDLGPDNFDSTSVHATGQPQIEFTFIGTGASVGRNGTGNGVFTGPNADNLGVVFDLSGPDNFGAAGAIRADRIP